MQLLEQQTILSWGLENAPDRAPIFFWCDDDGNVKDRVAMALPVLTHPPDWLLALPVAVSHPGLGDGTLVLPTRQCLSIRAELEPRLVRIDIDAAFAAQLNDNLARTAARLATMVEALERTRGLLRAEFSTLFRGKAAGPVAEWAIFLEEGSAFLFENLGDERNFKNLSARFDQQGGLTTLVLTTQKETTEHHVG